MRFMFIAEVSLASFIIVMYIVIDILPGTIPLSRSHGAAVECTDPTSCLPVSYSHPTEGQITNTDQCIMYEYDVFYQQVCTMKVIIAFRAK